VELFKKGYARLLELVDAKKTVYFQYQGRKGDTYEVDDYTIQLKAVQDIFTFLGVYAPRMAPLRYDTPPPLDYPDPAVMYDFTNTGESIPQAKV